MKVFSTHSAGQRKSAFTLAEVLITLGIIGVVAAMTLPAIVGKYNEYVTITQLKKTYSELSNAIKLSEVDNGEFQYWDYIQSDNQRFAEKYIMPYLSKNYKICTNCFNGKGTWLFPNKTVGDGGIFAKYKYGDKTIAFRVMNTECSLGSTNPDYYCTDIKYVTIVVDVNGDKGESVMGLDVFVFTLFNYTYKTGPWINTGICQGGKHYGLYLGSIAGYWGGYCMDLDRMFEGNPGNCRIGGNGYDCGLALQKNDWKVPDKYPLKF